MLYNHHESDYEPVTRSRWARLHESDNATAEVKNPALRSAGGGADNTVITGSTAEHVDKRFASPVPQKETWILKRGHTISYIGLFLFTAVLYFRPYELFPALSSFSSIAYWLAFFTLIAFVPSQFALEGTLTTRPREVNLVLLLSLTALISIPVAVRPGEAWDTFIEPFIKAVAIFIVIVNVVRTEERLNGLFFLTLAVSCMLSLNALNDFRHGRFSTEGYRVTGNIGGMFGNPNELALHLVTIIPIAVALALSTRSLIRKVIYALCAVLMVAGNMVTYSRGAFLGLIGAGAVMMWKLGRRNRLGVMVLIAIVGGLFLVLAPGGYGTRVLSIFDSSLDPNGSSSARQALFWRALHVAIANPVFGVGIGNFHILSIKEQVTHNSYTQVASEMGFAALVFYTMFIVTPLRRLRQIERETVAAQQVSSFYYLSIGLQASLVAYMISSFFGYDAYLWYIYYLVGYSVVLRRMYEAQPLVSTESIDTGRRNARESKKNMHRAAGGTSPNNERSRYTATER